MCATPCSDDCEDAGCGTDATGSKSSKDAAADMQPPAAEFVDEEFVDTAGAGKEFQWKEQLETLREMGLADGADGVTEWELVQLLEKHLGSLDRVVDSLIQKKTDMV